MNDTLTVEEMRAHNLALKVQDPTARILAAMMVENTGVHFLDSGMSNGRAWQRARASLTAAGIELTDEDAVTHAYLSRPDAHLDKWCGPMLDTFHYLLNRLEYAPRADHGYRLFVWADAMGDTERWDRRCFGPQSVEEYVDGLIERGLVDRHAELCHSDNSYNRENRLTDDIQYTLFKTSDDFPRDENGEVIERFGLVEDEYYVLLQIHRGADIRGGYTDPRMFLVTGGWDGAAGFTDWDSVEMWCEHYNEPAFPGELKLDGSESDRMKCDYAVDIRYGDMITPDGDYVDRDEREDWEPREDEDSGELVCPRCGGGLNVAAPPVG